MKEKKFKILQLDGGGMKGIIFLRLLCDIEKTTGKKIHDMFDLFIGTSTGGIAAALFARGMSAFSILDFYLIHGERIFSKNFFWWFRKSIYDRKYIDELIEKFLPMKMKDLEKKFICTSCDKINNDKEHFFKTYKEKYKNYKVSSLVKRTYSAPVYFGYLKDKDGIWSDGGVGAHNCTLEYAYIEALRLKKKNYFILSLGCGESNKTIEGTGMISQIKSFISVARKQATRLQVNSAIVLKRNVMRIDLTIGEKYDDLDLPKYWKKYIEYGKFLSGMYLKDILKLIV